MRGKRERLDSPLAGVRDHRNAASSNRPTVFRAALAAMLLACCTRTVETRSESAFQAAQQEEKKKAETLDEVVQTGPETITTTVEEFEAEEPPQVPAGPQAAAAQKGSQHPDGRPAPVRPLLIKRTVTIDQRGPTLDTKRQADAEASSATQTVKSEAKVTTTTKTAPALSGYVWMALAAAVLALIGWVAWKLSPLGKVL